MSVFCVRIAERHEFSAVHQLLSVLMGELPVLAGSEGQELFAGILAQPGTALFVGEWESRLTATATLHLMPNLTHGGRPYALIENVVTLPDVRGRGHGRAVMQAAEAHAWNKGAYKIMLLTGHDSGARGFYEALGYAADDKLGLTKRRAPRRAPQPP